MMMNRCFLLCIFFVCAFCYNSGSNLSYAFERQILKESAEYIARKFGYRFGEKTITVIEKTLARQVSKYGDDVVIFAKASGYRGMQLLDDVGDDAAANILRIHKTYGAKGLWIIENSQKRALFLKYGDDAATALIKHPGLADDVVQVYGSQGASALNNLGTQEARRFTKLLVDNPTFASSPHNSQVISVVRQYGDAAMNFIWDHKSALAGTTLMVAFLNDPEPYIQGVKVLVVEPITDIAGETAKGVVKDVSWNWIALPLAALLFLALGGVTLLFRIRRQWISGRVQRTHDTTHAPSPENMSVKD